MCFGDAPAVAVSRPSSRRMSIDVGCLEKTANPTFRLFQHAADAARTEREARTCERLGQAFLLHRRAQHLQPFDDVSNEIREAIQRLGSLEKRTLTAFVHTLHPRGHSRRLKEEALCRLSSGPTSCSPQFKDRKTLQRSVVRSSPRTNTCHPQIFEPEFFLELGSLSFGFGQFGLKAAMHPTISRGTASSHDDRSARERNRMEDRGLDVLRPVFRKRDLRCFLCQNCLLGELALSA